MRLIQLFESSSGIVVPDVGLFRGLTKPFVAGESIREVRIRTDRRPLDSSNAGTIVFNKLFEVIHGIPNIRSSSLFCTPSSSYAGTYSTGMNALGLVLPSASASFVANTSVTDSLQLTTKCSDLMEGYELDPIFNEAPLDISTCTAQELNSAFKELASLEVNGFGMQYRQMIENIKGYRIVPAGESIGDWLSSGDRFIEVMVTGAATCTLVNVLAIDPTHPYALQREPNIKQIVTEFLSHHNIHPVN